MLTTRDALLRRAVRLASFTVGWNVVEGVIAVTAAWMAGSRALLGFGLDSAVESLSGSVVLWRLYAERRDPDRVEQVERRAVRLIGLTFFALAAFVGFEAVRSLVGGHEPEASPVGVVLTAVSLVVMPWLATRKRKVGFEMRSRAVEADGAQTRACAYLSAVVLAGLLVNAAFGWWWADPLAALGVAAFLVREGWEALHADHVDECCA